MEWLDLTLPDAARNLALDEALLLEADELPADRPVRETLRLWEPAAPFVVLGRASQAEVEVRLDVCHARGIPVLRRTSGGATVVAGPGCLMYSLVLDLVRRPELRALDACHRFVLDTTSAALAPLAAGVTCRGTSDLVLDPERATKAGAGAACAAEGPSIARKVSGNSMQVKRRTVLYHGTLLYEFPLPLVGELLTMPPRQPEYRGGRPHGDFLANLGVGAAELRAQLRAAWQATNTRSDWPQAAVERLLAEKYGREDWNLRR